MIGAAGAGLAAAILMPHQALAAGEEEREPKALLTSAQVKTVVTVAKAMATVPVALPHRRGRDTPPLDKATAEQVEAVAVHLAPENLALVREGADTLRARLRSSSPSAAAATLAAHPEWDGDPAVAATLTLAAAVVTPLGFCQGFQEAWLLLMRSRAWSALPSIPAGGAR